MKINSALTPFGALVWLSLVALILGTNDLHAQPKISIELSEEPALCRAYQQAFQELAKSVRAISRSMLCERPIAEVNKEFSVPDWKFGLFKVRDGGALSKIDSFRWKRDTNPLMYFVQDRRSKWRGTQQQISEARARYVLQRSRKVVGHLLANVDIDNDGVREPVYFDRACQSVFGSILLVLKSDLSDIDLEKSKPLLVHPNWKALRKLIVDRHPKDVHVDLSDESALAHAFYGVFSYGGVMYFDYAWYPADLFDGKTPLNQVSTKLQVFLDKSGRRSEVCRFKLNMGE